MFILRGAPLSPDVAFTDVKGIQRPANWLRLASPDEREAAGVTEVPDPPAPPDQRFYWGWDADGKPIPKDHTQLVEQWSQQTRQTANTLLQPTDWIIIREADNGKPADPLLKTWRQDIRLAAGIKISAIQETTDTPALAAYITCADYPVWPRDPYSPVPVSDTAADGMEPLSDGGQGGSSDGDLL